MAKFDPIPEGVPRVVYFYDGAKWAVPLLDAQKHVQVDVLSVPTVVVTSPSDDKIFAVEDVVRDTVVDNNLSAGTNTISSSTVPANKVWVITHITIRYIGTAPTSLQALVNDGTTQYEVLKKSGVADPDDINQQVKLTLKAGDKIDCVVVGATSGDTLRLTIHGYQMDVA